MGLPQLAWVEKTVEGVETYWLSSKEKVLDTVVNKKGDANILLGHERVHHNWFSWKSSNFKQTISLNFWM